MMTKQQQEERYIKYMDIVFSIEGGYVNDPQDPGGETNWGITKRVAQQHGYNGSMRDMPKETAREIYRKSYWENKLMPYIMNDLALYMLCFEVHSGYTQAVKTLQRSLGVVADGVAGINTLNALSNKPAQQAMYDYNWSIMGFYIDISPKTGFKYTKGWYNRLTTIMGSLK